ncbi:hypothetical protein [Halorubrum trueperi]|uniref:Uncharacterized protein n=1 Tax=Halorubrum trueperi TaxID=2004704 RepID=A0ABD5ULC4_9EURY
MVPTDGSELARRALEEACTIAGLTDATINDGDGLRPYNRNSFEAP